MKKIPPANPVDWQQFGVFLFACREADPGYYVLDYLAKQGDYKPNQLKRLAVGWAAFYNLGIAARASELQGDKFYELLLKEYSTAKRGSERRHFRGESGLKAIRQWQKRWPKPEALADHIMHDDMGAIRDSCDGVLQMGDYFKWKWGDLTEVILQQPVNFRGYEKVSPNVPQQGAALIAKEAGREELTTEQVYRKIAANMRGKGIKSPYAPWREFDVQDAETICCVYKQYRTGGYIPGSRTAKAAIRLYADGGGCKTANLAYALLLKNQPREEFQDPQILNTILEGTRRYKVERFL